MSVVVVKYSLGVADPSLREERSVAPDKAHTQLSCLWVWLKIIESLPMMRNDVAQKRDIVNLDSGRWTELQIVFVRRAR